MAVTPYEANQQKMCVCKQQEIHLAQQVMRFISPNRLSLDSAQRILDAPIKLLIAAEMAEKQTPIFTSGGQILMSPKKLQSL